MPMRFRPALGNTFFVNRAAAKPEIPALTIIVDVCKTINCKVQNNKKPISGRNEGIVNILKLGVIGKN